MANYTYDILFKRYATEASAIAAIGSQRLAMAQDTRRLAFNDGGTFRYYWDATRLADQTTSYGTSLIGTPGITGITPDGGSSGAAATLQAMLTGLAGMISGTAGTIPKFTAAKVLGDSLLTESGNLMTITSNVNDITGLFVTNPNTGVSGVAGLFLSNNVGAPSLFVASAAYTADNGIPAGCLNISVPSAMSGLNVLMRGATDVMKLYFGSPASGTLFHTFSNKGIKLENIDLSTDADGTVAGVNHAMTLTKNDSNTRQFYGYKLLATLNAGGSNANTTIDLFRLDTVNTSVTGLTVYLARLIDGGVTRFSVQSNGRTRIGERLGVMIAPETSLHITQDSTNCAAYTSQYSAADAPTPNETGGVMGQFMMFMANNKLIFKVNDGGTIRYKYLDMTGTGATWAHSTTLPA